MPCHGRIRYDSPTASRNISFMTIKKKKKKDYLDL